MNSSKALLLTLFLSLLLIVQNASATGSRSSLLAPSVERRAIRGIPRLLETLPPPSESSDFADYLLNERDSANQLLFDLVRNRKHVSLSDWESHLKQIIVTPGFFHQLTNSGFNVALQQLRERTEPPPFIHKQEEALAEFRTWGDVFANKTARSIAWSDWAKGVANSTARYFTLNHSSAYKHAQRGSLNEFARLILTNVGVFSDNTTEYRRYNLTEETVSVLLKGQVGDYLYKNTRNPFARFVGVTGMTVGSVIGFEQLALEIPGFFASSIAGGTTIVAAAIGLHAGLVPELEDGTIIFYRWTKAIGSLPTAPLAVARGASRGKEMKHLVGEFHYLQLVIPLPPSISSASSSSLTEADVESYFHTVFIPKGIKLNGDQKLIQIIQQRKMVPFNSTDEGSIAHEQFSFLKRIKLFRNCSSVYNEVTELGWNKAIQLVRERTTPQPVSILKWSTHLKKLASNWGQHYINQYKAPIKHKNENRGSINQYFDTLLAIGLDRGFRLSALSESVMKRWQLGPTAEEYMRTVGKYKPFLKGVRLAGQITALASAVAILYELSGGPISFVAATAAAFAIPRPILNAGRAVASAGGNTAVLLASSEARHKSIDNFKEAKEKVRVYKNKTEPLLVSSVPEEEIEMFSIEKKIK